MKLENLGEAEACGFFNALIELDERTLELSRQGVTDRRLARSADSQQSDGSCARLRSRQDRRWCGGECGGDLCEADQRYVAAPALELGQESLRESGLLSENSPRKTSRLTQQPDMGANRPQKKLTH